MTTGNPPTLAYRRKEAARLLHISVRTLDGLIRERALRACRVGRKRIVIPVEAIREFLNPVEVK